MVQVLFFNVTPPRPGKMFADHIKNTNLGKAASNNKYGRIFIDLGQNYVDGAAQKITYSAVNKMMKEYRRLSARHGVKPGVTIGVIQNSDQSYICGSSNELSFKHNVNSQTLAAEANTMIYTDYFNAGRPSSYSLYNYSKNKLVDAKSLVDTERDYLSSSTRQSLTINFGFNQKSYNFLLSDTFMSVGDYKFLFKNYKDQFVDPLATKNIYGNIFYEHLNLKIKSETDYYTTRVRLHLVKIKNPSVSVDELINNTFTNKEKLGDKPAPSYCVPLDRQISIKPEKMDKFRSEMITDLKCSLSSSVYFKNTATIVKTFKRNLGPNDVWNFNYYLHYGPGLYLNRLFETGEEKNYRFPYGHDNHPCGYFFVIESKGDPRASVTRTSDGANFDGSSYGRIDVSFSKQLKFVRDPDQKNEVMTVREFISNDEDFVDSELANYFSPDRQKKINVNTAELNTDRIQDTKLPYQMRYGEGRLAVYLDPKLVKDLYSSSGPAPASELNEDPTNPNYNMTNSTTGAPGAEPPVPNPNLRRTEDEDE